MLMCIDPAWTSLPVSGQSARNLGLRYYFTGLPCLNGHVGPRLSKKLNCLICHRDEARDYWRAAHGSPERGRPKDGGDWRLRRTLNALPKDCIRARDKRVPRCRLRLSRPKDFVCEDAALMNLPPSLQEAVAVSSGRFFVGTPCRHGHITWRSVRNSRCGGCVAIRKRRNKLDRRRREREPVGAIRPGKAWTRLILVLQGGRCASPACRKKFGKGGFHRDHIKPVALGGSDNRRNIQLLCPPCNLAKGALDPIDFVQSLGLLI